MNVRMEGCNCNIPDAFLKSVGINKKSKFNKKGDITLIYQFFRLNSL